MTGRWSGSHLKPQAITGKAADLTSALKTWDYLPEVDVNVNAVKESIADVVTSEFQDAIATTEELLSSISDYRKSANLRTAGSLLIA